ncbi:MAG TPA: sigma-70 family RNA polymerase sigma factor [Ilumatobacteraceae bacterium]|jgi:RNA polymerase sigma-70 factor (ECF subfamily)
MVDLDRYSALFRQEHPRLVALGIALTGDRELSLDLAQETLLRAYRSWATIESYEAPGAWLRRVLINQMIDGRRRSAVEAAALRLRAEPEGAASGDDPMASAWWVAVRSLPERQRIATALYYVDDYSVDEVAAVMKVASGTVKATLAQARRSLGLMIGAQREEGAR